MLVSRSSIGKRSVLALFTVTLVIALIVIILGKGVSVDVESRPIASTTAQSLPALGLGFSVTANPTSATVNASSAGTSTITVTAQNGFSGLVNLASNSTLCTLVPTSVTGSGISTLSCNFASAQVVHVNVTATNGVTQHSAIVTYTVQDFAIAASAPSPVNLGIPASSAITVAGQNGFAGNVTLSTNLTTNALTCAFYPPSVTLGGPQGSNLSCSSTMAGSFRVTITGKAGQLSHATSVTMTFGDFSITANPSTVTIQAGSNGNSTINLTNNGYNGQVTLSTSQLVVNGLIAVLNPSMMNLQPGPPQSSVLTLSSTSATPAGVYSITITSSSTTPHIITVNIIVQGNFTMTLANSQLVVVEGEFAKTSMTVASSGLSNIVTLYATPPKNSVGLHGTFAPLMIHIIPGSVNTTILSVFTFTNTAPGVYNMTLTGASGPIVHSIYLNVTVSDFSILVKPNPISIPPNSQGNATVILQGILQFNGTIILNVTPMNGWTSQLSAGNVTLSAASTNATVTLTIQVPSNIFPRVYTVTVTGTIGGLRHDAVLKISVVEFTINVPSIINLPAGQTGSFPLTVTSQNSFTGVINLTSTVAPNIGLTVIIAPVSISLLPNQTVSTLLTLTSSIPGFYFLTINGTSGHSSSYQFVQVYIGDFTISVSPSLLALAPGSSRILTLTISSAYEFSGTVNVNGTSKPAGINVSASPQTVSLVPKGSVRIIVNLTASQVPPGTFSVTIMATSGSLSNVVSLPVIVALPPLLNVPSTRIIDPGSLLTFIVNATDSDQNVRISTSGLPPGASFITSYRTGSTTIVTGIFNWKPSSNQAPGDYEVTFTAQDSNGGITIRHVTIHVNGGVNRSLPLPSTTILMYSFIAGTGIVATLLGGRVWRNRKIRATGTRTSQTLDCFLQECTVNQTWLKTLFSALLLI